MAILEELKREHETLVNALAAVDASKVGTEEGKQVLFNIKDALLAHLEHEDSAFYPGLKEAAKKDESLAGTLKEFEDDMKKITTLVLSFFEKYTSDSVGNQFDEDFQILVTNLKERILMEEDVLFRAYERVNG